MCGSVVWTVYGRKKLFDLEQCRQKQVKYKLNDFSFFRQCLATVHKTYIVEGRIEYDPTFVKTYNPTLKNFTPLAVRPEILSKTANKRCLKGERLADALMIKLG